MSRRAVSRPSADKRGLRPPWRPRARAAARPAWVHFAQQVALHLGEHGADLQHGAAHNRGGVDPVLERAKADTVALEALQQAHELVGRAAQPVKTPDHESVTTAEMREGGGKAGPVGARAGGAVLEGAMAPRVGKGIALEVQPLVLRGHPGIADHQRPGSSGVTCRGHNISGRGRGARVSFRAGSHA